MLSRFMRRIASLAMLLLISHGALAQDQNIGAGHAKVLEWRDTLVVNPDATFVEEFFVDTLLLTDDAARDMSKPSFSFNSKLESIRVIEAYTLKVDGRRVDVPASAINTQEGVLSTNTNPSLLDYRLVVMTFPQVAKGDRLVYRLEKRQIEATLPGHFEKLQWFGTAQVVERYEMSIDAPDSLGLQVTGKGLNQTAERKDGRTKWTWTYSQPVATEGESAVADVWMQQPHVLISNFKTWDEVGAVYWARAKDKTQVTPQVTAVAQEIFANQPANLNTAQQTKLVFDWVRQNIRYVASYVGAGGWVPHDADTILKNRYGDCKDTTTILVSLLAARGIEASPVLITSGGGSYTAPALPSSFMFNHAITYVPSLDLYLDSTDELGRPDLLPAADADRLVVVATLTGNPRRTPAYGSAENRNRRELRVTIHDDGSASGVQRVIAYGHAAQALRYWQRGVGQGREALWVKNQLRSIEGAGTVKFAEQPDGGMLMEVSFRAGKYLANLDAGGFWPGLPVGAPVTMSAEGFDFFKENRRKTPFICQPLGVEDDVQITFPAGIKVLAVPRDRAYEGGGFRYQASARTDGQTVQVRRSFTEQHPRHICGADEFTTQQSVYKQIERAISGQVLYQSVN
jgi:transglutaminase-like putative cysteine protease